MPTAAPDPLDDLQFETVEQSTAAPAAAAQTCIVCKRPIQSVYYAVRGKIVCPDCAARIKAGPPGNGAARLLKGFVFGLGPACLGALVWGAILYYFHYQIGLIAVALGYMIGKGVKRGSGGRGGPIYQAMAVLLAYSSVALAHFPRFYQVYAESYPTAHPVDVAIEAVKYSFHYPITSGSQNPIGLLIIGFALWEAWKFTKYTPIPLTGPYQLAAKAPPIAPPLPSSSPDSGSESGVVI